MENQKNIPALRFPGFDGEWVFKKIDEISTKVGSGNTPLGGEKVYQNEGVIFIRSQNVNEDTLVLKDVVYISEEINSGMKNSIVQPNDILLNITGASLGRSCVVPKTFKIGNVNQHVCIIRLKSGFEPNFLQPFFSSSRGQKLMIEGQTGSGREGLNFQTIRGFKIRFPTLPEQEKIAAFLTAVDEKLRLLKIQESLLKEYKKGVMQKIFSQELRFKDENGADFPDWEERSFFEVLESLPSKRYQLNSKDFRESGKFKIVDQGQKMIAGFSNQEELVFKNTPVIIFGDHTTILKFIDFNFIVGADGTKLLKNKADEDLRFLYYYLCFNNVEQEGYKRHFSILSEKSIQLPVLKEQTKIASFLKAIDEKIEHCATEIERTGQWKKGLLQQMFC